MIQFLRQNPFVRLLSVFIPGILVGSYFKFPNWFLVMINLTIVCIFLFDGVFTFKRSFSQNYSFRWVTGASLILIVFLAGVCVTQIHRTPIISQKGNCYFKGTLNEIITNNGERTRAKITTSVIENQSFLIDEPLSGQFYFDQAIASTVNPGDVVEGYGQIKPFVSPTIPYQFDYGQYLNRKGYSFNFWVKSIKVISHQSLSWMERLRLRFSNVYNQVLKDPEVQGVVKALVLGDRSDLTSEIKQAYVQAGVIHVLAVSGLHVGILFWMIASILRFKKNLRWIRLILILVVLWLYAWLTNFSPSVLRATIMFSIILIGKELGEKGSLYNSLAISAFFILLIDPMSLYDVGFWLSHLAVLGMGLYYQQILNWFKFDFFLWKWLWSMVAVSLAAQVTTFPIIIGLFNGFPVYFLLANILILPASPFILGGAILLLFLPVDTFASNVVAFLVEKLVGAMDWVATYIAHLPGAYWSNASMTPVEMALFFITLLWITIYLSKHQLIQLRRAILCVCILMGLIAFRYWESWQANDITVKWSSTKGYVNILNGQNNLVVLSGKCQPEEVKAQLTGLWGHRFAKDPVFVNSDTLTFDGWIVSLGDQRMAWINHLSATLKKQLQKDSVKWIIVYDNQTETVETIRQASSTAKIIWIQKKGFNNLIKNDACRNNLFAVDTRVGSALYFAD